MEMLWLLPITAAGALLYYLFKPPGQPEASSQFQQRGSLPASSLEEENRPAVVTVHAAPVSRNQSVGE